MSMGSLIGKHKTKGSHIEPIESGALVNGAKNGDHVAMEVLLQAGADVNEADDHKATALMWSVMSDSAHCVNLLVQAGADLNAVNECAYTPLMWAAHTGADKCMGLLIQAGADVNTADRDGITAVMLAVSCGYDKCLQLLIQSGADVNKADDSGMTAIMLAVKFGNDKCLQLLIEAGADVNTRTRYKRTALILTCNSIKCMQLLLKAGAYINVETDRLDMLCDVAHCNNDNKGLKSVMLLYAGGTTIEEIYYYLDIPVYKEPFQIILELESKSDLKNLCRNYIRKHLLRLNPCQHLYDRIPRLGLPEILSSYLLYGMSLDENYD